LTSGQAGAGGSRGGGDSGVHDEGSACSSVGGMGMDPMHRHAHAHGGAAAAADGVSPEVERLVRAKMEKLAPTLNKFLANPGMLTDAVAKDPNLQVRAV
jgi:hypothetical protein